MSCDATHSAVPQQVHSYGLAYSFGGPLESYLIPLPSLHVHGVRGLPLQVVFHLMTQSTPNLWWVLNWGDSGVMMGYQVDKFTHVWFAEHLSW